MWDIISTVIGFSSAFLVAYLVWRLQQGKQAAETTPKKKISISLMTGLLFGFILFKAINPDSQLLDMHLTIQLFNDGSAEQQTDLEEFKRADGSLRFFPEQPCP